MELPIEDAQVLAQLERQRLDDEKRALMKKAAMRMGKVVDKSLMPAGNRKQRREVATTSRKRVKARVKAQEAAERERIASKSWLIETAGTAIVKPVE